MSEAAVKPESINPLEQALVVVIQKTTNAVEEGVDFLAGQLPDVIHQLLMWHAVKAGMLFAIMVVVAGGLVYLGKRLHASYRPEKFDFPLFGFVFMFAFLPAGLAVGNLLVLVQILIAPKVYLIEYAAKLIR